MAPVVQLDLLISPRIFEKNSIDPNAIIRGLGEDDSRKNQKQKACDAVPLKTCSKVSICISVAKIFQNNEYCCLMEFFTVVDSMFHTLHNRAFFR